MRFHGSRWKRLTTYLVVRENRQKRLMERANCLDRQADGNNYRVSMGLAGPPPMILR